MTATDDLFEAITAGDAERVKALVTRDPSLASARNSAGVSALQQARYQSRLDIVDTLVATGHELDVFEAASLGDARRLSALVDADPARATAFSADGFTPLHFAAFFGTREVARLLLERGADPDAVARNPMMVRPLHSAAAAGRTEIVELLLARAADVNARQQGGWTTLHAAAANGNAPMVRSLLQKGANPGLANDEGKTAADMARAKGYEEVLRLLASQID